MLRLFVFAITTGTTHAHTHTRTGHFPGEPGLASCAFVFPSPFVPVL